MPDITAFFLNSNKSVVQLELLEIYHPNFSKIYRIVRNYRKGITVVLETGESFPFQFVPTKITSSGARNDLDVGISVSFGDLGELLPQEIDNVLNADGFGVAPIVTYRTYRSDDLSGPLMGPFQFEIITLTQNLEGATFQAQAPGLNYSKTGELYRIDRFKMLRGFL